MPTTNQIRGNGPPESALFSTNPGESAPDNAYLPNNKRKPKTNVSVNLIIYASTLSVRCNRLDFI
jgi:hypothetical protein